MKRNNSVTTPRSVASSAADGQPAIQQSPGENGGPEEHQALMTRGELAFSLRDVHCYWNSAAHFIPRH